MKGPTYSILLRLQVFQKFSFYKGQICSSPTGQSQLFHYTKRLTNCVEIARPGNQSQTQSDLRERFSFLASVYIPRDQCTFRCYSVGFNPKVTSCISFRIWSTKKQSSSNINRVQMRSVGLRSVCPFREFCLNHAVETIGPYSVVYFTLSYSITPHNGLTRFINLSHG